MRRSKLALALAFSLAASPAVSEEPEAADAEVTPEAVSEEVPPELEAVAIVPDEEAPAAEASQAETPAASGEITLGPVGRDEQGRVGRIHVVASGDTLWDISDAYLGTPWVWPSIWNDNGEIENPHLIHPQDRIWITPEEMRRVSEEEAARLLAAGEGFGDMPANFDPDAMPDSARRPVYTFKQIDETGFVSVADADGAATILDAPTSRKWLEQFTTVVIGLGAGEVSEGDQLDVFRPGQPIADPDSRVLYGYHTDQLGWVEVTKVGPETSEAVIRYSRSEMQRGDHLLPRTTSEPEIEILDAGPEVDGKVVYAPAKRLNYGTNDVVYLDRGASHGVAVGHPLEIFRELGNGTKRDAVKRENLALPDFVIAKLLVVSVNDSSSVAVVTHTTDDIEQGDRVRGSDSIGIEEPR